MLIVGAKGFAKEILQVLLDNNYANQICFFDDVNLDIGETLYDQYPILKKEKEIVDFFKTNNSFAIGLGEPLLRKKMYIKFLQLGGVCQSIISKRACIGEHDITIGEGTAILPGANISNSVTIGKGCIIYYNSNITHDCSIGDFVEISPSVNVLGRVEIGSYVKLGSNSTILPDIRIGNNVVVGAGSVVTKDTVDNVTLVGIPAKVIKTHL